jgi:Resolvase, N terminal domain
VEQFQLFGGFARGSNIGDGGHFGGRGRPLEQELEHLGVGFVSLTEALDLITPAGRAMAGLLAIFTEFEQAFHWRRRPSQAVRSVHFLMGHGRWRPVFCTVA